MKESPRRGFALLKVLAYLVLGIAACAGVFILLKAAARESAVPAGPVGQAPPVNIDEARAALAQLREKAAKANPVTDALIAEIHAAGNRWNALWAAAHPSDLESPFDQLAGLLSTRRAEAAAQAFAELQAQVDTAMKARKYSDAINVLSRFRGEASLVDVQRDLVRETLDRIDSDYATVEEHGSALVEAGRYAEASRWYAQQSARFQGTDRFGLISARPAGLSEVAHVDEMRRRRESEEAQARAAEEIRKIFAQTAPAAPASGPATPAAPPMHPFLAKITEKVNQGRYAEKKYQFSAGISGAPTAATAEGLTVSGARIAWPGVPAEILFLMAGETFHADEWIIAAEYAVAAGHPTHADRFLWRYAGGADRKQRQAKIDETLARFRGLKSIPEGGFTYDAKAGWEDRVQRSNRTAVEEATRHIKSFLAASDPKSRDKAFTNLRNVYLQAGLADEPREKVRAAAVEALLEFKRDLIEDLSKKAKATGGLGQIRALKILLNERREAALKVIYDPKIYLPEDDPRWQQGDKVNGQEKVDELVESVREIWEHPGRFVLGHSRLIERGLEEIKSVNERYFPAFGLEGDTEKDVAAFEEVRNNLNEQLSVKSYSLNGGDRQAWEWNRRVDRYNDALKDAGITRDEIEHARVLNDYREMMGRRRVFLDARLCRATKKHSAVCDRAGRIWHVGEDGDPESRARAEGFSAGVSENVAIGYATPGEIWTRGWYRASDHHRNGLNDSWNCMGYGYVGRVGTQNFSNIGNPRGF